MIILKSGLVWILNDDWLNCVLSVHVPGGLGLTCNSGFKSALHMSTSLQHFMTNVSLVFWEYSHWRGFSGG